MVLGVTQRRVALQPGDDAAAGRVQLGPPGIVVTAEVEHGGGARLDRHGLGRGAVVDPGRTKGSINRSLALGVVDLAQGRSPRELGVEQRRELALGAETALVLAGAVHRAQPLELVPRHLLQNRVQDAILLWHGTGLLVPERCPRPEPSRVSVVHRAKHFPCRTAVGQARP